MAILKYYNTATSAWEYIAASTTANFTSWKKTMSGGETSVSGTDDNAVTLSYTVGLEQVFINGVLQVRGTDYTATDGTSVTGLSALVASDIVTVVCYAPFNVANTIAPTVVDAKGDLLAGTAADTVGRLAVGTNGQLLAADSGETTGLKWTTPASNGLTLISTTSFSAVSSVSLPDNTFSSTYDNYLIVCSMVGSTSANVNARMRVAGSDNSTASSYVRQRNFISNTTTNFSTTTSNLWDSGLVQTTISTYVVELFDPFLASPTAFASRTGSGGDFFDAKGYHNQSVSYDSFSILPAAGTITGKYSVYGYNK